MIAVIHLVLYHLRHKIEYLWQFEIPPCHTQDDELIRNDFSSPPCQFNLQVMKEKKHCKKIHSGKPSKQVLYYVQHVFFNQTFSTYRFPVDV